jgi:hypothetical protein
MDLQMIRAPADVGAQGNDDSIMGAMGRNAVCF